MNTIYDFATIICFLGLIAAFFLLTDGNPKILMHFLLSAVVLAFADQVGNAGLDVLALIMIVAAASYTAMIIRG
jgi:hypothetical protein